MRNFPTSEIDRHNRLIESICNSILNSDPNYTEAKATVSIARAIRKESK
jgi:hypothetical protein